jgi:anaerobic selenocysteine-containing dehydrogenase
VVVDPRRTETAEKADHHLFIKPGGDFYFLAALAHVMFEESHIRLRHLAPLVTGLAELREVVAHFSPEAVVEMTGIEPDEIRRLARDFARAERGICYGRIGTCVQEFGGLAGWMLHAINILTGNLDREGGMMFCTPAFDGVELGPRGEFGKHRTRVRGLPSFGGEFPASALAEEILTPGKGQIRLLATHAGNPVLSTPNGRQLDEALAQLDFMFSIDIYINETTRHADVILPPTSALERSHMDLGFALLSVRNFIKWSPPMVEAPADSRHDWQILLELSNRLGEAGPLARLVKQGVLGAIERMGLDGGLDLMMRFGPYGTHARLARKSSTATQRVMSVLRPDRDGLSLAKLKEHPHGLDLGPLTPRFPAALCTRDKQVHLAPEVYLADVRRAKERLHSRHAHPMLLIGRRHVRSNNSWLHNSRRLVKGKGRCTAWLHPDDAARLQVADGQAVRVTSRVGSIELPAEITDAIMPGVVSVPHGWGHGRAGVQLAVAGEVAGVSVNDVTDEQHIDALTGMPVLNGVPVAVSAVAVPVREGADSVAN